MTSPEEVAEEVAHLFVRSEHPLNSEGAKTLGTYLAVLSEWSRQINLTGYRDPRSAAEGLLYDAQEIAPLIPSGSTVLDVGAGAGGLAVALATLLPDISLSLVEPTHKRAVFLRTVIRELGFSSRMQVEQTRAESLSKRLIDSVDVVYAKAVMPPEQWLELGPTLVRSQGGVVLCLTAAPLCQLSLTIPSTLRLEAERIYTLPISGAPRVVTALRQVAPQQG